MIRVHIPENVHQQSGIRNQFFRQFGHVEAEIKIIDTVGLISVDHCRQARNIRLLIHVWTYIPGDILKLKKRNLLQIFLA